jgi:hypothetical protein
MASTLDVLKAAGANLAIETIVRTHPPPNALPGCQAGDTPLLPPPPLPS